MTGLIQRTELEGLRLVARGKVRDIYEVEGGLLLVATDRLSAFDVVLPTPIPWKGRVLTSLAAFWFERTRPLFANHLLSADLGSMPAAVRSHAETLEGRTLYVRRARVYPVECVVRGYLSGSGWRDYRLSGEVCGIRLPPGLSLNDRLPEPIFTPSTKAATGHDENIPFEEAARRVGRETLEALRGRSLALYRHAAAHCEGHGVLLADTKFEWGEVDGEPTLVDEALTPDSSRFWPAASWRPREPVPSFDKQGVRDHLEASGWDKRSPAPALPEEVVRSTTERYLEIHRLLTGRELR